MAISQVASSNPDLWIFENARVRGLLSMLGPPPEAEQRAVFAAGGQLIADTKQRAFAADHNGDKPCL